MSTRAVKSWHRMLSRIHTPNLDMLRIVGYTNSADGERKLIAATPVSFTIQKIKHEGAVESIRVATFITFARFDDHTFARFDDHTVEKNDTVKFYNAHPESSVCSCPYSDEIDREYQVAVKEANDLYGDGQTWLSDEFVRPDVLRRKDGRLFCECAGYRPGKPGYGRHPYKEKWFYFGAHNLQKLHEQSHAIHSGDVLSKLKHQLTGRKYPEFVVCSFMHEACLGEEKILVLILLPHTYLRESCFFFDWSKHPACYISPAPTNRFGQSAPNRKTYMRKCFMSDRRGVQMLSSTFKHDNPNIDFERTKAGEVNVNIFESHLEYLYCKSLQTVSAVIQNALTLQNSEIMQVLHFTGLVQTVENSEEYHRGYLEYVKDVNFHCKYCVKPIYAHSLQRAQFDESMFLQESDDKNDDDFVTDSEEHEERLEYGDNAAEIAADNMAATFASIENGAGHKRKTLADNELPSDSGQKRDPKQSDDGVVVID